MAERRPVAFITRVECFSASHRLHSKVLSDDENKKIFGKCNNPNGHGHNYKVEVTVKGPIDESTGMVINVQDLKTVINDVVMNEMDHRNLDLDVAAFRDTKMVSTTENLTYVVFEAIRKKLPSDVKLDEVKIHETPKNIVVYRGDYE